MAPKTNKRPESVVREIKRKTRRKFNPEEKIRTMLGLDSAASTDTENITTNIMASITLCIVSKESGQI